MTAGLIDFRNRGDDAQPSPSIWAKCPRTLLNDLGTGVYIAKDFAGADASLPGLISGGTGTESFAYNTSNGNRIMRMTTDSSDNDSVYIATRPLGRIVRNSPENHRLWFETRVALVQINDQSFFAGLVEQAGVADDLLSNDPGNNDQAGLKGESLIGFVSRQVNSATTKLDLVYRKDNGSVVTVLEDVTNATALNQQQGANGEEIQPDLRGDLAVNTFVKLGLSYQGNTNVVRAFVNGVQVATFEVDSTVDQNKEYAAIVALHNGTAAARSVDVDFFRVAAQHRT